MEYSPVSDRASPYRRVLSNVNEQARPSFSVGKMQSHGENAHRRYLSSHDDEIRQVFSPSVGQKRNRPRINTTELARKSRPRGYKMKLMPMSESKESY